MAPKRSRVTQPNLSPIPTIISILACDKLKPRFSPIIHLEVTIARQQKTFNEQQVAIQDLCTPLKKIRMG